MTVYDFGKVKSGKSVKAADDEQAKPTKYNFSGIPKDQKEFSAAAEKKALRGAEELGFVDRGQGTTRRKRSSVPQKSVYIKGPEEIIDWLIEYCNDKNHSAYWNSIEDLRAYVEGQK